jgi:hypothetical protein
MRMCYHKRNVPKGSFIRLTEAIERMDETSEDGREKYGLKLILNAIIQRIIKSLKG